MSFKVGDVVRFRDDRDIGVVTEPDMGFGELRAFWMDEGRHLSANVDACQRQTLETLTGYERAWVVAHKLKGGSK